MEWIAKLFEAAKLPTKFIVSIFLASTIPLFLHSEMVSALRLSEIIDTYGSYMGVVSVLSGSILVIEAVLLLIRKAREGYVYR